MKKILVILVAFVSILCVGASNISSNVLSIPNESNAVVRYNTKLMSANKELYLYKDGSYKIISNTEVEKGTYSIEDRENIAFTTGFFQTRYGKIYYRGGEVSRVIIGGEAFHNRDL